MSTDPDAVRRELEERYLAWFEAVTNRDLEFFEATLAPDWHYVDSSGGTRDRASYIDYVAGLPEGVLLKDPVLQVRLFEPVVLVHGTYEIARKIEGMPPRSATRFTAVWQRSDDSWQALAHQATTIEEKTRR